MVLGFIPERWLDWLIKVTNRGWEKQRRRKMSFAPEVLADSSGKWAGNAVRFATREEAEGYVRDLMMRWTAVRETRVVESTDPVKHKWVNGRTEAVDHG
jgi:hypothetical protein